jgi:putative ABC transport system permease protein
MVTLAWRMLRRRPTAAVATFVAMWFGVAVVTACGVLLESGLRYHGVAQRYAASTVLVATGDVRVVHGHGDNREVEHSALPTRGGVDASVVTRAAALPGVQTAVGDVATPAQVLPAGGATGVAAQVHPWAARVLAPFTLRSGRAPGDGEAVLDSATAARIGARPGSSVRVMLPGGMRPFVVSGVAATTGAAPADRTVFVTMPSGPRVDVVGVIGAPGTSAKALARAVDGLLPHPARDADGAFPRVYTGPDRGLVETPDVAEGRELAIALPSVFGGCTLFIAALVIAGTVGLSVQQRHRDVALLRAVGATPRQVRRMVVRESAMLAVLAGASGVWAGFAGVTWLRDQFVHRGITPASFTVHVSWLPPLVAAASALVIAVGAAWIASLRVSRIRPTEALVESAVERRGGGWLRGLLGLGALAGGLVLAITAAGLRGDNAAGLAIGVLATLVTAVWLIAPWLNRAAAAVAGVAMRALGVTGRLAAANAAASARRLAPVLSALVLAVGFAGSLWFLQTSVAHRATQQSQAGLRADYVVTAPSGLPAAVVGGLRQVPGVQAVTGVVRSTILDRNDAGERYTAQGIDGPYRTFDLGVTSGSLADLRPGAVAIDRLTADAVHARVGDEFRAWYPDGTPAVLRVAAVYSRGLGFAAVTLPAQALTPHTSGLDTVAFVSAAPSARAGVQRTLDRLAPGASVLDRGHYQTALDTELAHNAWSNQVVVGVLLVYVVIAAVNTLAMAATGRRRELAVLRLTGTTRKQILRMVRFEQTLLLSLGLVVGGAVAAATLLPLVKAATGTATPYLPLAGWAGVLGGTVLLGSLATLVPVRRILRINPVEAIGIRE